MSYEMKREEHIMSTEAYIGTLIQTARAAQRTIENATQEEVLRIAAAIGWYVTQNAKKWAELDLNETGMGVLESKIARNQNKPRHLMRDLKKARTVGIIEEDKQTGLIKIAKPVGVIGVLAPTTVGIGVTFICVMNSIMGRNATIISPHPRAQRTTFAFVGALRDLLERLGYDPDLLQCIEQPRLEKTNELMRQCDLIVATGGTLMVKAAYSSGTPAYGVGAGNVVSVIDETADFMQAAEKIRRSQLNDLAIGCSTENSVVIQKSAYQPMMDAFKQCGAYVLTPEEKQKLQGTLWIDGHLNTEVICTPASNIAKVSGFTVPDGTDFLLVEETGCGKDFPFSWEKLSVVVTVYQYDRFEEAIALTNGIQSYSGAGHSCGIHSQNEDHILAFAMQTKTSRVGINCSQNTFNAGNWNSPMPATITLGCGTWGGNITTENVHWKHYINVTWVGREIPNATQPTDESLFGDVMQDSRVLGE